MPMSNGFPKRGGLLRGCILAYLVDCIMTAQHAFFTRVSWKGEGFFAGNGPAVYGMSDGQGIYGAITFERESLVGIFFDTHSERSPHRDPETYDLNRFFEGMPSDHRILVNGPLEEFFIGVVDGQPLPEVTAAFWDKGEYLTATDPWDVVLSEGARVVRIELMEDIDQALAAWQEEYEMSPEQAALARLLLDCKLAHPTGIIELSKSEVSWLRSTCKESSDANKEKAIAGCRDGLAALGIRFSPVVTLNPAWQTPTVLALATAAYENRILPAGTLDATRLAILADALEDAGCDNAGILNHCRQPSVHVRGCWVVDLVLGKE
jgi:hypothetical protein